MKMNSTKGGARARLLTSTLLAGLATVAAPLAVTAVATAIPTLASAQDYSSGSLLGTVKDSAGVTVPDATVTVKSLDQGFTRTVTTDGSGQFRVPLIPIGGYSVSIAKEGYQPTSDGNVRVALGGSTAYSFTLTEVGASVSEVVVTATANPQLDFAATTKGLTVDMETLTKQAPVARSLTAVVQLAPGVVTGSSSRVGTAPSAANFGAQPSVGGGSVAENAFYVNGLNITNFDTYIGAAEVPFDFYKSVEVKTGGYPAEFGRATGGVINAVTKSGSNDFKVAVHGNFESDSLREDSPDTYIIANHRGGQKANSGTFEVSGPIIKDHLFFYVLNQQRDYEQDTAFKTTGQYTKDKSNDPFWGAKLDGYITDRQRVELTYFDTQKTIDRTAYAYNATTDTIGAKLPSTVYRQGGVNYVARYTGTFTDWFTLSAAYGRNRDSNSVLPGNTVDPLVQSDVDGQAVTTVSNQKQGTIESRKTLREFYRIDGDFYFNLMGDHHIRTGYDHEKTTLNHASIDTGPGANGIAYIYHRPVFDPAHPAAKDANGVLGGVNYVEVSTNRFGGAPVHGGNEAWYIQDAWDITPSLNLQLGIRHDNFTLDNLLGEQVLNLKDNWGPRIGVTWDPVGEGKDKISASFGRYYIPPASNLSYRGADLGYSAFFYAPGYVLGTTNGPNFTQGANSAPTTLGTQITTTTNPGLPPGTFTGCPQVVVAGSPNVEGCTVSFGLGIAEPAYSKAAVGIKASQEDEYTVGYERQFNDLWKGGVNLTYRKLNRISEDTTLDPFVVKWCNAHVTGTTLDACETIFNNSWQYIVFNPGEDLTIKLRQPDSRVHDAGTIAAAAALPKQLTFSKDELGFPKPKREYIALEFTFERAFDGKWGLKGSYVLSESKGNYEGTVLSDNNQADAGSTVLYDFVGLTDNQYGLLPNHHAHQFKVFGSYAVTDNLMFGANARVISPKHQGCLGRHPTDGNSAGYGAASRICDTFGTVVDPVTGVVSHPVLQANVPVPRGSAQETDWTTTLDLSMRYTVPEKIMPLGGNLVLRADIFNVFNADSITSYEERGETNGGGYSANYRKPIAYQEPRYVRFGFDLDF
jgi:hypothetical protein